MAQINTYEVEQTKRFSTYLKIYSTLLCLKGLLSFPEFQHYISHEEKEQVKKLEEQLKETISMVNQIGKINDKPK